MLVLTLVTLFIGGMYAWMGVSIRFFGKVGLINNYYADEKAGKFGTDYARRVGGLSIASGVLCLGAGLFGLGMNPGWGQAALLLGSVLVTLVAFRVHYVRSDLTRR